MQALVSCLMVKRRAKSGTEVRAGEVCNISHRSNGIVKVLRRGRMPKKPREVRAFPSRDAFQKSRWRAKMREAGFWKRDFQVRESERGTGVALLRD